MRDTTTFRLTSDVLKWASEARDSWLEKFVHTYLEDESAWGHFVAVGVFYRHAPLRGDQARRRLEAIREGRFDAELERELTWVRDLDPEILEQLECHALALLTRMAETLKDCLQHPDPEDAGWCAAVLATLVEREELEAVRRLFRSTPHDRRLEMVLRTFDFEAEATIRALPEWADLLEDELLKRGLSFDRDAWWVYPWASTQPCSPW